MTRLRALLIDLSGTLHVSDTATPGAAAAIRRLREAGIALRWVSNTSKESKQSLLDKMKRMDLDVREEELFTSLSAVRALVDARGLHPLYLLSPSALSDFPPSPPSTLHNAVVIGLAPNSLAYHGEPGLNTAFRLLAGEEGLGKGKVSLIVTHRATVVGDKDGKLSLGPGPFITALEEASGVKAEVVGKPTQAFFEIALRSLEKDGITSTNWTSVGMIGDDWRQDTGLVAHQLGLRRYLVQTGKFRPGDETRLQEQGAPEPEWTGGCFAEAVEEILKSAE